MARKIRVVKQFKGLVNLIIWGKFLPEWDDENIIYIFDIDRPEMETKLVEPVSSIIFSPRMNSLLFWEIVEMFSKAEKEKRLFWNQKDFFTA